VLPQPGNEMNLLYSSRGQMEQVSLKYYGAE